MYVDHSILLSLKTCIADKSMPILPPPPKNSTPSLTRRNPFNRRDSSGSEEEILISTSANISTTTSTTTGTNTGTRASTAPLVSDTVISCEINEDNDDTECLIDGMNLLIFHTN